MFLLQPDRDYLDKQWGSFASIPAISRDIFSLVRNQPVPPILDNTSLLLFSNIPIQFHQPHKPVLGPVQPGYRLSVVCN
jgi:hypothetical protein